MSQRASILSLQDKTQISLTTVAGRSSMDLMAEGFRSSKPFYLIAFVVADGAVIVKA
jgi:hypothetical protein